MTPEEAERFVNAFNAGTVQPVTSPTGVLETVVPPSTSYPKPAPPPQARRQSNAPMTPQEAEEFVNGFNARTATGTRAPTPVQPVQPVQQPVQPAQQPIQQPVQPQTSSIARQSFADPAIALVGKGVAGVSQAAIGLLNIPTLGAAGKLVDVASQGAEAAFKAAFTMQRGFDIENIEESNQSLGFEGLQEMLDALLSPEMRRDQEAVSNASGFLGTVKAAIENPRVIPAALLESIPSMMGGGAISRTSSVTKLAKAIISKFPALGSAPIVAAALGEGLIGAGSTAEEARTGNESGFLTPAQAAVSTASGAATALLGIMGGKLASKLGLADFDQLFVKGGNANIKLQTLTRVITAALQEGALEELPQSLQESIAANINAGRPWDEGVAEGGAMGMLVGMLMGGGSNVIAKKTLDGSATKEQLIAEGFAEEEAEAILAAETPVQRIELFDYFNPLKKEGEARGGQDNQTAAEVLRRGEEVPTTSQTEPGDPTAPREVHADQPAADKISARINRPGELIAVDAPNTAEGEATQAVWEALGFDKVVWIENQSDRPFGATTDEGILYVQTNASRPGVTAALHEAIEVLNQESPEEFQNLSDLVHATVKIAGGREQIARFSAAAEELGENDSTELVVQILQEFASDKNFWQELSTAANKDETTAARFRKTIQRIIDFIDDFMAKVEASLSGPDGSKRLQSYFSESDLPKVRAALVEALNKTRETAQESPGEPGEPANVETPAKKAPPVSKASEKAKKGKSKAKDPDIKSLEALRTVLAKSLRVETNPRYKKQIQSELDDVEAKIEAATPVEETATQVETKPQIEETRKEFNRILEERDDRNIDSVKDPGVDYSAADIQAINEVAALLGMEQPTTEQIDATKGDTLNVLREQLVDKETIKTSGKNHILVARSPNGIWFVAPKLWVHGDLTTETLGGLADYWRMMREGNTFATREEAINAGLNQMEAVLKLRHRRQSPADEKNRTKILDAIEKTRQNPPTQQPELSPRPEVKPTPQKPTPTDPTAEPEVAAPIPTSDKPITDAVRAMAKQAGVKITDTDTRNTVMAKIIEADNAKQAFEYSKLATEKQIAKMKAKELKDLAQGAKLPNGQTVWDAATDRSVATLRLDLRRYRKEYLAQENKTEKKVDPNLQKKIAEGVENRRAQDALEVDLTEQVESGYITAEEAAANKDVSKRYKTDMEDYGKSRSNPRPVGENKGFRDGNKVYAITPDGKEVHMTQKGSPKFYKAFVKLEKGKVKPPSDVPFMAQETSEAKTVPTLEIGRQIAKEKNLKFNGIQENAKGRPDEYVFTDPETQSTFQAETPEDVDPKLRAMRARFRNAEYAKAVESKDTAAQQRIVDEAAKAAGYNVKAYHGTNASSFNTFKKRGVKLNFNNPQRLLGWFFAEDKKYASQYGKNVFSVFLKGNFSDESADAINRIENSSDSNAKKWKKRRRDKGYTGSKFGKGVAAEFAVFTPEQIKSAEPITRDDQGNVIPLSERFDDVEEDFRFMAQEDTPKFKAWFKESKVSDKNNKPIQVYHGTQRPDRVGNKFDPKRATSGPMAFFTDDPKIASSYATGKSDTSIQAPDSYAGWFKLKPKGRRKAVDIDNAWYNLTPEQREKISQRLPHVVNYDANQDEMDGYRLGDKNEFGMVSESHWEYVLNEKRGNVLAAALDIWVESAGLFNSEKEFIEVLKLGGLDGVIFDSPYSSSPAVYPAYLSIQNPLDTSDIPNSIREQIFEASKRKRGKQYSPSDQWDKSTPSGKEWIERLEYDKANNSTLAWTSIPDWVTNVLKRNGYDGIQDMGGKNGGIAHTVWIPFQPTQIKSSIGNRGTFDPNNPDIRFQAQETMDPDDITPVNETEESRVRGILDSMKKEGWKGDPILVMETIQGQAALTGSHRLEAAKRAGIEVPVIKVDTDRLEDWFKNNPDRVDDFYDRYGLPNVNDSGPQTVIDILRESGNEPAAEAAEREIARQDDTRFMAQEQEAAASSALEEAARMTGVSIETENEARGVDTPAENFIEGTLGETEFRLDHIGGTGAIHLRRIEAFEPGNGQGTIALRQFKDLADRHGIPLTVDPMPLGDTTEEQLEKWYAREGFIERDGQFVYQGARPTPKDTRFMAQEVPRSTRNMMQVDPDQARQDLGMQASPTNKNPNKTVDIGKSLNQKTIDEGLALDERDVTDEAAEKLSDAMIDEVLFALDAESKTGTGEGWYSSNYPKALKRMETIFPEFKEKSTRDLFTAIVAVTSNGEKVRQNLRNSIGIFKNYRDGKPLVDHSVKSRRGAALDQNLVQFAQLIESMGTEKALAHLMEETTVAEINAYLRSQGKKASSEYTADTVMPRAALYFGPKLGAFYANLMGSEGYLTMDLWWSRTFNRMRGTLRPRATPASIDRMRELLGKPNMRRSRIIEIAQKKRDLYDARDYFSELEVLIGKKEGTTKVQQEKSLKLMKKAAGPDFESLYTEHQIEKVSNSLIKKELLMLNEAPARATDRSFMIKTAQFAQKKLADAGTPMSIADIQAALWYYEKRLYARLSGRSADDIGYVEAIDEYIQENDQSRRRDSQGSSGASSGAYSQTAVGQVAGNGSIQASPQEVKIAPSRLSSSRSSRSWDTRFMAQEKETPAFKRWFGDSKVVDKNGSPLVVRHATDEQFNTFDKSKRGDNTGFDNTKHGFFFLESEQLAKNFANETSGGNIVMSVYLSIKNPIDLRLTEILSNKEQAPNVVEILGGKSGLSPEDALAHLDDTIDLGTIEEMREALNDEATTDRIKALGYDGIISDFGDGNAEYIAFEPTQIKSATENRGTFDPSNADIRFMAQERDEKHAQAVKSGKKIAAQNMVDEAAKAAGYKLGTNRYNRMYHITRADFKSFKEGVSFFTPDSSFSGIGGESSLRNAKEKILPVYINPGRIFDIQDHKERLLSQGAISEKEYKILDNAQIFYEGNKDDLTGDEQSTAFSIGDYEIVESRTVLDLIKREGYDSFRVRENGVENIGVLGRTDIKSADAATYDDAGNLIPLSERFDNTQSDIRFMAQEQDDMDAELQAASQNQRNIRRPPGEEAEDGQSSNKALKYLRSAAASDVLKAPKFNARLQAMIEDDPDAQQSGFSMERLKNDSKEWIESQGGIIDAYNAIGLQSFNDLPLNVKTGVAASIQQAFVTLAYETKDEDFMELALSLTKQTAKAGLEYGRAVKALDQWRMVAPSTAAEAAFFARTQINKGLKKALNLKGRDDIMGLVKSGINAESEAALKKASDRIAELRGRLESSEDTNRELIKGWDDARKQMFKQAPVPTDARAENATSQLEAALAFVNGDTDTDQRFMAQEGKSQAIFNALVTIAKARQILALKSGADMSGVVSSIMTELESISPQNANKFDAIIAQGGALAAAEIGVDKATPARPAAGETPQKRRAKKKREKPGDQEAEDTAPAAWLNTVLTQTDASIDEIMAEVSNLQAEATLEEIKEAQEKALERLKEIAEEQGITLEEAQALVWDRVKDSERAKLFKWAESKLDPNTVFDRVQQNSLLAWGRANGMPDTELNLAVKEKDPLGELQKWANENNIPGPSEVTFAEGYDNLEAGLTSETLKGPEAKARQALSEAEQRLAQIKAQGRVAYELQQTDKEETGKNRALKTILDEIIREPMQSGTKIVEQLQKRIIDKGWPEKDAERMAKEIADAYAELIDKTMRNRLLRKFIGEDVKQGAEDTKAIETLIMAARTNKLSDTEFTDAFAKKYGLKTIGQKERDEIERLGKNIEQKATETGNPNSTLVRDAQVELNDFVGSLMPSSIMHLIMTFRKQAMLSGFSTAITNTVSNAYNTTIQLETLIIKEFMRGNFSDVGIILRGAMMPLQGEAFREFWRILKDKKQPWKSAHKNDTGYAVDPTQHNPWFNKGGYWNPLKFATHVFAWMQAQDYPFYLINEGAAAALQTAKELRANPDLKGKALHRAVARQMGWGREFERHMQQAKNEGFTGKEQRQRAYELRRDSWSEEAQHKGKELGNIATYNVTKVPGVLGKFSRAVTQMKEQGGLAGFIADVMMPFTNIPFSVANAVIANSPLGFFGAPLHQEVIDAATGKERPVTADDRLGWSIQATKGSLLMLSGILLFLGKWREWKDDDDEDKEALPPIRITANGPHRTGPRQQWLAAGNEPYTITVYGFTVSYRAWSSSLGILGPMGAMQDMLLFGDSDDPTKMKGFNYRVAMNSLLAMPNAVLDQTSLMTISDILKALESATTKGAEETTSKINSLVARTVTSVVPNVFKQLDNIWDPSIYPNDTIAAAFLQNVPFAASGRLKKRLNIFGEPIELSALRQFYQLPIPRRPFKADPIAEWLIKNEVSMGPPHYKIPDKDPRDGKIKPRSMDDEEKYRFMLIWGPMMKKELTRHIERGRYKNRSEKNIRSHINAWRLKILRRADREFIKSEGLL